MSRHFAILAILVCIFSTNLLAQNTAKKKALELKSLPSWIWLSDAGSDKIAVRHEFEIKGEVKQALLAATADNQCDVFINDKKVVSSDDWAQLSTSEVGNRLQPGKNVVAISARNDGGPAGVLAILIVTMADGTTLEIGTDETWRGTGTAQGKWRASGFDDKSWGIVKVLGKVGDVQLPWSASVDRDALMAAFGSGSNGEFIPEVAANANVPEGFKIERIFHVPRAMGSWVALAIDPKGRLIASDQGGAGLFMITPGTGSQPTTVEKMPVNLSGAQGLLWAFDSLYAVVNGGEKSGLHRLRDTNGDGLVDSDEHCMLIAGGGEHGPHAVTLSPDGKSLFVAAGNHTKLPEKIAGSRIPQNWNEDMLLPRRWDANGHAAGILAPGGWICNVDESGKNWEVFSMGYRNQYDIAFNQDGELFTYDSDMEWDFGSPWYRPTRVCHATSGSEFGWRSGTGNWPAYFEDSLPAAVDIGPGSPTGIVFGAGAKFPAKYQRSLFILDWTYSTIYSIELTPEGSSYRGKKSDFVTGSPLPVTDAVVGNDGALYFAAGGRGTQSDLYRVTYVGSESTAPVTTADSNGAKQRELRHKLEAFHGRSNADLNLIMANMGHEDRFMRYAARVALENQPISKWRDMAFATSGTKAVLNAMMAMAHQGTRDDLEKIVEKIASIKLEDLAESDQLFWLRTLEVAFARHGEPSDAWRLKLVSRLDSLYPAKSYTVNAELVQLLVFLKSPTVITKTLALMDTLGEEPIPDWGYLVNRNAGYGGTVGKMLADMPPVRAIHFAFVLRNVKTGWTLAEHKKYFEFFIEAAKKPGGNSYAKFLMQFRDDALASCSPAEMIVLEPIISKSLIAAAFESKPAKGPGRKWTTVEALATVNNGKFKPDFETGRNLYHATSCAKCHRIGGEGGSIGPDLSTAGKKFSTADMLDAIIEPSKAISDQYGSQQVLTSDGKTLIGRAVEIGEELYVYTADAEAKPVILKKEDVEQVTPSKISQMPTGLIDVLNEDELRHLMAYVMSAGDNRAKIYK